MSQMDPSTYMSNMSPMDLYDSIFWGMSAADLTTLSHTTDFVPESPDPFYNTGADMNFDFMPSTQQPPGNGGGQYFY